MDVDRYAQLFLTESREQLAVASDALLALERGGEAAAPVRELFRAVHTVKGMSGAMGFAAVTELAHAMEALLAALRAGERAVAPDVVDALFAANDALEDAVAAAIAGRDGSVDATAVLERLAALADGAAPDVPAPAADAAPPPAHGVAVVVRQAPDTPLAGARATLLLQRLGALGRVLWSHPDAAALAALEAPATIHVRLETDADADAIARAARAAGGVASVEVAGPGDAAVGPPLAQPVAPAAAPALRPSPGEGTGAARASGGVAGAAGAPGVARSVRIDARRLDALLDLAGEMVIARGRLQAAAADAADPALRDAVTQLSRLVGTLQDEVLSSRLAPVGQVFARFPRLVRDTARALGKEVELALEGQELELDRSLLDEIGEPLVHLLRNAIDHGIEAPAAREAAGKPRAGRLTLSATRDRDAVLLRVADDGAGIDRARVADRARALGLLPDGRALGDEELVRLVSRAGFTTRERATDVSGRGVGVDAVHARLRALGGAVDIRTRDGAGTTVTLRLPLTLAIVRTVLARVGDEVYAVPASHVAATAELAEARPWRVRGEPVLSLGDDVVPSLDLRALVGLPAAGDAGRELLLLDAGPRRIALVVDELLGQQEAVVKRFDAVAGGLACFSGATILGNGMPALIVDVGRLLA